MTSVEVPVPDGVSAEAWEAFVADVAASQTAVARIAAVMEQQSVEVAPATVAQLARVEHLRRHLIERYGVYTAADIAKLRGGDPSNRSTASKMARHQGLLALRRGRTNVYPCFQFQGVRVHPRWRDVTGPLIDVGWDAEDVLLWMVSPNPALGGAEPAELLDTERVDELIKLTETEALGVW